MSVSKRYLKTRPVCKVTFRVDSEAAGASEDVRLVGDFNGWDAEACPMTRLKSGDFSATLDLEPGHEYQFRYLMDGVAWENDWAADAYAPSGYGSDNSVVTV